MIWLTGHNGLLGSEISNFFLKHNILFVTSNIDLANINEINHFLKSINCSITTIINTASYTNIKKCEDNPHEAFYSNAFSVFNLAQTAKRIGATLIHFSTNLVFDSYTNNLEEYKEFHQPNPKSVYGRTKYIGEKILEDINPLYYIFRTSSLFGKNKNDFVFSVKNVLDFNRNNKTNNKLDIVSDIIINPTYTKDITKLIYFIISDGHLYPGLYHVSCDEKMSYYELANRVQYIYNDTYKTNFDIINPILSNRLKSHNLIKSNIYLNSDKLRLKLKDLNPIQTIDNALIDYFKSLNPTKEKSHRNLM